MTESNVWSRRHFLAVCTTGFLGAFSSGCIGSVASPEFRSSFRTYVSESFVRKWNQDSEIPYYATIITSQEEADNRLNWDTIPTESGGDLPTSVSVDFSSEFMGIFQTTLRLHPQDTSEGGCPRPQIKNGELVFSVPLAEWPDSLDAEDGRNIFLYVGRWSSNFGQTPQRAQVQIEIDEQQREFVCGTSDE